MIYALVEDTSYSADGLKPTAMAERVGCAGKNSKGFFFYGIIFTEVKVWKNKRTSLILYTRE